MAEAEEREAHDGRPARPPADGSPSAELRDRLLGVYEAEEEPSEVAQFLDPFQYTASANYVVPMLIDLAASRSNDIVDAVPRYSSLDHSVIWNDLIACLLRFDGFLAPYFSRRTFTDPFAEELLSFEHRKLSRRHAVTSLRSGLWTVVDDEAGPRIRPSPTMRRSALHLVADRARALATPPEVAEALRDEGLDSGRLARTAQIDDLKMFAEACPDAWRRLQEELPFELDHLGGFRAFALDLARDPDTRWATGEHLELAWAGYSAHHGLPGDVEAFRAMLQFHAVTVEEARSWGLQAPFLRWGETYAAWFFVYHVLPPDLHFLALLTRRAERLWSTTVGADLALVADWLGSQLPPSPRLRWVARRRHAGGDADLVLLDSETGEVLVLELKAVFDKFRTHVQLTNFTDQKVNFPKAIQQARDAAARIRDGSWSLRALFGRDAPARPARVTAGVLTWWDTFNPTLDEDEYTLCCNFDTFLHVLERADGDLTAAVTAITELSGVFCPGVLLPYASLDEPSVTFSREVQSDALPPDDEAGTGSLGPFARSLTDGLPQWTPEQLRRPTSDGHRPFTYPSIDRRPAP